MAENSVGFLTPSDWINLLILCMKADGLNNDLVPDGTLGEQATLAAKKFIAEEKRGEKIELECPLTNSFLQASVTDEDLGKTRPFKQYYADEAIRIFFARYGISL